MSAPMVAAAQPMPAVPKPRPYRRYLTSALHTRFIHAVLLALFNSFILAFLTGKDYFWSWFPFGPAGLKAILFSMSSLFVFVLQLSSLNIGRRTSVSALGTIKRLLFEISTYQTIFWYTASAWWFCEAYIWAVPESHNMGWVIKGSLNEPDRLNERPIYLRFFFTIMALVQSVLHLYFGQSFLHIPISQAPTAPSADQQTHPIQPVQQQLRNKLLTIILRATLGSSLATVTAPFIYKAFFRETFWKLHLAFAKPFFNLSRSNAHPPRTYFIGPILLWAFVVGIGLSFAWEMAAQSFLVYLKQTPLKNGLPLSAGSKDPNGTLLNGLMAKRSVAKTFATWELALIAQMIPDRRRTIFADFERPNGPMWTSMSRAALSVVSEIDTRIAALNPTLPQPSEPSAQNVQTLPRITRGASNKHIVAALPRPSTGIQRSEQILASANKAIGQSTNPWSPPVKEAQQALLEYAKPAVGSGGNTLQQKIGIAVQNSPLNGLFRVKGGRRIAGIILGSPAGNAAIVVDAIEAVTKMLVASLNEDQFGKAVQTVPESVKQFTKTVLLIETYVRDNLQAPTSEDELELEEVIAIVGRLKAGLRELLSAFQVFLNDAGLSIKDLNEAKRASEERSLIPLRQTTETNNQRSEMEQVSQHQQRSQSLHSQHQPQQRQQQSRKSGSRADSRQEEDDPQRHRARETAQSLKRIEAQPRRQRLQGSEDNVFGARDLSSGLSRRNRDGTMVR